MRSFANGIRGGYGFGYEYNDALEDDSFFGSRTQLDPGSRRGQARSGPSRGRGAHPRRSAQPNIADVEVEEPPLARSVPKSEFAEFEAEDAARFSSRCHTSRGQGQRGRGQTRGRDTTNERRQPRKKHYQFDARGRPRSPHNEKEERWAELYDKQHHGGLTDDEADEFESLSFDIGDEEQEEWETKMKEEGYDVNDDSELPSDYICEKYGLYKPDWEWGNGGMGPQLVRGRDMKMM